jgi:hypothetical protein
MLITYIKIEKCDINMHKKKHNMGIIVGSYYDVRVIAFESKMFQWWSSIFNFYVIPKVNSMLITAPKQQ